MIELEYLIILHLIKIVWHRKSELNKCILKVNFQRHQIDKGFSQDLLKSFDLIFLFSNAFHIDI